MSIPRLRKVRMQVVGKGEQSGEHKQSAPRIFSCPTTFSTFGLSVFVRGTGVHSSSGARVEAPPCSYVEAFSTATCSLDVGIVEDKFAGELRLHKVHLRAQKGQLSLLLYEDSHTCKEFREEASLLRAEIHKSMFIKKDCSPNWNFSHYLLTPLLLKALVTFCNLFWSFMDEKIYLIDAHVSRGLKRK